MKAIVYDCEIRNAIPTTKEPIVPNIHYCRGWDDLQGMGIACVTAYDLWIGQYRVFLEDNLNDFAALQEDSELVVGFNNNRFDDDLMAVNGVVIHPDKTYDILQEIWHAAGHGYVKRREDYEGRIHGGYALDDVVAVNLKMKKVVEKSQQAPVLWQHGKQGQVIDHGLMDTWFTTQLFTRILNGDGIMDPKTGRRLEMPDPRERLMKRDPAA